jgi:hypothetical protein
MKIGILQRNILIASSVIFILFLIILLFNYADSEWRKLPQKCPDFWVEEENGQCYNIKGLGKCNSSNIGDYSEKNVTLKNIDKQKYYYMDFTLQGDCDKQKWANGCDIAWDGITYGYGKTSPCN